MAMNFSDFVYILSGFTTQLTECKYCISVLRYDALHDMVYFVPMCPIFVGPVTYGNALVSLVLISKIFQPEPESGLLVQSLHSELCMYHFFKFSSF